ncbi:hypothetical protein AC20117_22075 (plasmid) [Arthrobacter crystallopoietes]|nr:hypothetical protein AC20117_22075 [Arthrobacter crystallopoietes]
MPETTPTLHNLNGRSGVLAAGLRAGSRPRAAAAPSGSGRARDSGAPAAGRWRRAGVLARVLPVAGAAWFRSGMQVAVLPAVGPAGAQREVPAGVGFKHTFPCGVPGSVLAAEGPRGFRTECGQGSRGRLSAWPHRPCCGRGFAAGSVFGMMDLVLLPCLFGAAAGRGRRRGSGSGKSAWIPRFSRGSRRCPGGGFAVVREGV